MIKRHYVDTRRGQLHVRTAGSGPNLVLLHWAPLSSKQYLDVIPHLASAGYRVLAFDLMGFGQSDPREGPWQTSEHADVVVDGLTSLGAPQCSIVGGHFSNNITVELAHRDTLVVDAIGLDGGPFLPPEVFEDMIKRAKVGLGPGLHDDGSHRTFVWDTAVNALSFFDPDFELTDETVGMVYDYMSDYLATGMPDDQGATAPYDLKGQLSSLTIPTLVLAADTDPLRPAFEPMLELLAAGTGHCFSGGHPLINPKRASEYAGVIVEFLAAVREND